MSLSKFAIVESTLREGEQFVKANFSLDDKLEIAEALAAFGVEYIELTSPIASPQSRRDCERLARLGLPSKILTHIRCHLEDAKVALATGVTGINLTIGSSSLMRQFSHGKNINQIIDLASEVLTFIHQQAPDIELRFSAEDSSRTSIEDLITIYSEIEKLGVVKRIGIADTVGISTPMQVFELVKTLRQFTNLDIEFHGHNDTECANANSYTALEAGATHIDTSVLGIGERNGITSLAGFIARLYATNPEQIKCKYRLEQLAYLHELVARKVGISIPFNHCIFGESAFSHKAGIHTKAMLNNSETYEAINPRSFGVTRSILINHKLAGKQAVNHRANELGLSFNLSQLKDITHKLKTLADKQSLTIEDVDNILYSYRCQ